MRKGIPNRSQHRPRPAALVAALLAMLSISLTGCSAEAEGAVNLERLLPAGHSLDWYAQRLESSGYEVTAINYERQNYAEYEVVKDAASYEVQLLINTDSGAVEKIAVADNLWTSSEARESMASNEATIEVPTGTRLTVKLNDYLDSGDNEEGDTFTMSVAEPVVVSDEVAIPQGTLLQGHVASVEAAQRPNKGGRLVLKADSMRVRDEDVEFEAVVTAPGGHEGDSSLEGDLAEIAGGAGLGGLVGGLIGGGKGVLAGVLVGGGGMFLATKGEQIELPPDTELIVELREPVRVPR